MKPNDFVPREPTKVRQVSAEEGWQILSAWARAQPQASPQEVARHKARKAARA